jgi:gamma-glutamyltranspeptidase/glutathione hydrolase
MMMMRILSLCSLAICGLSCCVGAQSKWYTPFPYKMEKEATGDSAMVVSAHPLATQTGLEVLQQGGNAVDAAVAVQFALAVVYPQAGNIGGGGFLIYHPENDSVVSLDFREKAPEAATEKMFLDSLGNIIPNKSRYGVQASGVPGSVDGMWELHQKYGRLPWDALIQPAIELADKGFQITDQEALNLNREKLTFVRNSSIVPAFVKFDDWKKGDWLIQHDLAQTLSRISAEGRKGFYEGGTAALILREMEAKGGIMRAEDLKNYKSVWRKPLEFDYKDLHIITMAPPSSGGIILQQLLGMTRFYPLAQYGFHTAEAIHLMAEAERRAFADRAHYLGDPDFVKIPAKGLADTSYLRHRMRTFDAQKATVSADLTAGIPPKESEETTHFAVVDWEGNAISVTTTLNDSYGSRSVVAGTGFILNNEMDDFSAKPGVPNIYGAIGGKANAIAPGKRPLSSMTPVLITKKNKVWMALGTPGGTTIPTSVFQIIVNMAEFGMTLPEAVQAKRFHHQWKPDQISIEEDAFSQQVQAQLEKMGHFVNIRSPIGRVEAIVRLPNGLWQGVADPRGDDTARGF